jgi:type II secretory pathway pseudopilin PulG
VNGTDPPREATRRAGGFSLVEAVVALGLLAGVLIAISGLFTLANQQLDGGRNHTVALAAAKDIVEEMNGWGFRQVWTAYGFDGSAASYTVDSRTNAFAAPWQAALENRLSHCHAEIVVESVTDTGPGPALRDAAAVRLRVTVFWSEGPRGRSVSLATVRI